MTNAEKFKEAFGFVPYDLSEVCKDGCVNKQNPCRDCPLSEAWWKKEFAPYIKTKPMTKEESRQTLMSILAEELSKS